MQYKAPSHEGLCSLPGLSERTGLAVSRGLSIPKAIDCFTQQCLSIASTPRPGPGWQTDTRRPDTRIKAGSRGNARALELRDERSNWTGSRRGAQPLSGVRCFALRLDFEPRGTGVPAGAQAQTTTIHRLGPGMAVLSAVDCGARTEGRDELLRLFQVDPFCPAMRTSSSPSPTLAAVVCQMPWNTVERELSSIPIRTSHIGASRRPDLQRSYEEAAAMAERALAISGRHSWALHVRLCRSMRRGETRQRAGRIPRIGGCVARANTFSPRCWRPRPRPWEKWISSDCLRAAGSRRQRSVVCNAGAHVA